MKKIIISQPNFFSWLGYFEMINHADEFIILDDVQYTTNDWRNRNFFLSNGKKIYFTFPVSSKNHYRKKINEIELIDYSFNVKKFEKFLRQNYSKSVNYEHVMENIFKKIFFYNFKYLNDMLFCSICNIVNYLGINTNILKSSDLHQESFIDKNQKLINIIKVRNGSHYLTSAKSKNYIDLNIFNQSNITLNFFNYKKQKVYTQQNLNKNSFCQRLSILDLIFNEKKPKKFIQKLDIIK